MYLCLCNGITSKMLENNSFLAHKIGDKCGICIRDNPNVAAAKVTYLLDSNKKKA